MADGAAVAPVRRRAAAHLREHAAALGLRADAVRVEYVLNWGGFVNQSFHVTDGRRRLHLKLSGEPEGQEGLRRWADLHRLLEERYRAPRLLSWLDVPGTGCSGLLFEHLDGAPPASLAPALAAELGAALGRLHADAELAAALPAAPGRVCLDAFRGTYLRRFAEDLALVRASAPDCVADGVLDWIEGEAAALERRAEGMEAFHRPVEAAAHGDLWLNNVLVAPDGAWFLLDWDDLGIGDPAMDLATLVGPTRARLREPAWSDVPASYPAAPGMRERFEVYARAALLDWVLDPLADHVGADAAPEHAAEVRREKERIHRAALARYRRAYRA